MSSTPPTWMGAGDHEPFGCSKCTVAQRQPGDAEGGHRRHQGVRRPRPALPTRMLGMGLLAMTEPGSVETGQ